MNGPRARHEDSCDAVFELLDQLLELANGDLTVVQTALREAMESSGGHPPLELVVKLIVKAVATTQPEA